MNPRDQIPGCIVAAVKEFGEFSTILAKQFSSQLSFDLSCNLPEGMVKRDTLPKHTLRLALVASIGEHLQWDSQQASKFAAEILEDSNVHNLAKMIYEQIDDDE